ncbi:MAG: hypothetical protein H6739_39055 [Alphaproteobacteria bacterium]|nr:hypothetical protein [Alphaproteobacteria bacterium]
MRPSLLTIGLIGACATPPEECAAPEIEVSPADGVNDAFILDPVTARLDPPMADAQLAVEGVAGVSSVDAEGVVTFTPDGPLEPLTAYTATLSWCDASTSWTFMTSALGMPLDEPEALDGAVFRVQPWDAEWIEPANANGVVTLLGEPTAFLLRVDFLGDNALGFTAGVADPDAEDAQDLCLPTAALPDAALVGAIFSAPAGGGTVDAELDWGGAPLPIDGLRFDGVFTADGGAWARGSLAGELQVSGLATALGEVELGEAEVCSQLAGFGVDCQPCTSGEGQCLPFHLERVSAERVGAAFAEVDVRGCDPGCPEAADNPECEG